MADEKTETGMMGGLLVIALVIAITFVLTVAMTQRHYEDGCQERCYPHQMESMNKTTGCVCAEAQ